MLVLDGTVCASTEGTIQYNLKLCVATVRFRGETCRIASLLVPRRRRNASVPRTLTTLERSLHFQDQVVLRCRSNAKRTCCFFPRTSHQGEEGCGDGKKLAELYGVGRLVLLNERFNCRLPACR